MPIQVLQLFANTGGDDQAALDIPTDGDIVGIKWAGASNLDTDDDSMLAEVSFLSTNTLATNDARGMIDSIRQQGVIVTTGAFDGGINFFTPMPDGLPTVAGERVHLHISLTAGAAVSLTCQIHLRTRTSPVRRSQRRR